MGMIAVYFVVGLLTLALFVYSFFSFLLYMFEDHEEYKWAFPGFVLMSILAIAVVFIGAVSVGGTITQMVLAWLK